MNRLLSHELWPTISKLAKHALKRAAIAYVSSDQHIQFGDGDLLICDASPNAIQSGQTSATVLKRAYGRRAQIYNLPGLHAKIILLNEKAVIGSANASSSSANNLIEAGLLTDQPTIVANAQSFVNRLVSRAKQLERADIETLLAIKVSKRGRQAGIPSAAIKTRSRSHRTWVIGTTELVEDPPEDQAKIEDAIESCRERLTNPRSNIHWLRWTGSSRFREHCRADDWLIQLWRPQGRKLPTAVYERMPVLKRLNFKTATYFLHEEFPRSDSRAKGWAEFKKLAIRAGIRRRIKPGSEFEITENQADSLQALWKDG